jgi:TCP-1/cpn60 chaperonin family
MIKKSYKNVWEDLQEALRLLKLEVLPKLKLGNLKTVFKMHYAQQELQLKMVSLLVEVLPYFMLHSVLKMFKELISTKNVGINIIREACKIPTKTICANAGFEGSIVVDKLIEANTPSKGFNAAKGEYVNMIETGIIDPVKVVRTALVDASGVASLMITTEAMIVELP